MADPTGKDPSEPVTGGGTGASPAGAGPASSGGASASSDPEGFTPLGDDQWSKFDASVGKHSKKYTNGHNVEPPEGFYEASDEAEAHNEPSISRTPPNDIEAEAAVLSAIMVGGTLALAKVSHLRKDDFYSEAHSRIYEAATSLMGPIDIVTVASELRAKERLAQVGGTEYLTEILNYAPETANVRAYARIVEQHSQQRKLLLACQLATSQIYARTSEPHIIIEQFRSKIELFQQDADLEKTGDVVKRWREEGSLVHVPTGFPTLDTYTGGGPVFGSRWYVIGAPDAGKTAFLVQLGHEFAEKDIAVGFLAVDEEPGDVTQRLAQRIGVTRHQCEKREENILNFIETGLSQLPIRFYGVEDTIEAAADQLSVFARELQKKGSKGTFESRHPETQEIETPRAVLLIDSIQTVTCAAIVARSAEDQQPSMYETVTANVAAVRAVASRHKILVISTSEMGRAYYSQENKTQNGDMAAAKQSGAIEYSARVMMVLRSVKGEPDLICADLPKNKHGPSNVSVYMRINRSNMKLYEAAPPATPDKEAQKQEQKQAREDQKTVQAQAQIQAMQLAYRREEDAVRTVLQRKPGASSRDLRTEMRVELNGCSDSRTDAAVLRLVRTGEVRQEKALRGYGHFLVPPSQRPPPGPPPADTSEPPSPPEAPESSERATATDVPDEDD